MTDELHYVYCTRDQYKTMLEAIGSEHIKANELLTFESERGKQKLGKILCDTEGYHRWYRQMQKDALEGKVVCARPSKRVGRKRGV